MNGEGAGTGERSLPQRVRDLLPRLKTDLGELVALPSVSEHGYPEHTRAVLLQTRDKVAELFAAAGCSDLHALELPDTAPIILGGIPAPAGAPTVLLYSHYDVVGAGDESDWRTPPFEAVEKDGAIYGRGAADTKSNIVALAGALRAWDGKPPVGVKLVIEGQEEVGGGALLGYPLEHPELFAADVMLIGDMGSIRPGVPTLTVALRGMADVTVEVRTLGSAKHSGVYGGAAPDALLALIHALSTLHDENGDVAVPGLKREPWPGGGITENDFRSLAEVQSQMPLIGTGDLGSRVWSGPAITVIGIDAPKVDGALNAVSPYARALVNLRVHPEQEAEEAQAALMEHMRKAMPYGIGLEVTAGTTGNGFAARTRSAAYKAARAAWSAAWGAETITVGSGGSIPLVNSLSRAVPQADILLAGTTDGYANIHGPNERLLVDEFEKATLAEADLLGRLAAAHRNDRT